MSRINPEEAAPASKIALLSSRSSAQLSLPMPYY
jgi:hypothetical protein